MGNILIIAGFVLIAAGVILMLLYRAKPLKYTPPQIRGEAVTGTSYTTHKTASLVSEAVTAPEAASDAEYEDKTMPLFQIGQTAHTEAMAETEAMWHTEPMLQTDAAALTEAMLQPEDIEPTVDEEGTIPMFQNNK